MIGRYNFRGALSWASHPEHDERERGEKRRPRTTQRAAVAKEPAKWWLDRMRRTVAAATGEGQTQ